MLFVVLWAALLWGGAGALRHAIAQRRNRKAQKQAEPETISPTEE